MQNTFSYLKQLRTTYTYTYSFDNSQRCQLTYTVADFIASLYFANRFGQRKEFFYKLNINQNSNGQPATANHI